jgi:hypothetical protein
MHRFGLKSPGGQAEISTERQVPAHGEFAGCAGRIRIVGDRHR